MLIGVSIRIFYPGTIDASSAGCLLKLYISTIFFLLSLLYVQQMFRRPSVICNVSQDNLAVC